MVNPNRKWLAVLTMAVACILPQLLQAQDSGLRPVSTKYAIKNATIVQSPDRTIQRGVVVFEDGIIKSVGSSVSIPNDAVVIDADSMYVYAGFISGPSNIGVPKPKEDKEKLDSKLKQNPPNDKAGITPGQSAIDLVDPKEKSISDFKKLGFTAAMSVPHKGMLPGTSSLIILGGESAESMLLKENYSLYSQLSGASGMYPNTVIGVMAKYRDLYRQAKQASDYQTRYMAGSTGMQKPARNLTLEALYPIVKKEQSVTFKANGIKDIMRVFALQKDLGFKLQLTEVKQGWDALDRIKQTGDPIFFSLDLPEMKEEKKEKKETEGDEEEGDEEEKEEEEEPKEEEEKSEADLEKEALEMRKAEMIKKYYTQFSAFKSAGVKFGFSTLDLKSKDFKKNLQAVMKNGLEEKDILAALTTTPAQIMGLSSTMGTVESGKMANIIVTDKPYFEEKSNVRYVFVNGEMTEYEVKKEKKKKKGTGEDIDPNGKWSYSYSSDAGEAWSGNFEIKGAKGSYEGTFYLSFNDSNNDLQDIEVSGNSLTFSFPVDAGGASVDVSVALEVDGDSATGTLTAGAFGQYEMEATRGGN